MREINICFEITVKVFVPTLVLSEDAEVIDLFFCGYSSRISFAVNCPSLKLFFEKFPNKSNKHPGTICKVDLILLGAFQHFA